jgi:hypothetical protein
MTLEICIAIAMQLTIINEIKNLNDEWGRALCFIFCVAYGVFLIFVLFFLLCPCSPAKRMEKYKARVGALYEEILFSEHWANKFITIIFIFKRIAFATVFFYIKIWHLPIF